MNLYDVTKAVATELRSKGWPFPVVKGPERFASTVPVRETRIVLERIYGAGADRPGPSRSQHVNPHMVGVTACGVRALIYAKSPLAGAQLHDHEELAFEGYRMLHAALEPILKLIPTLWRNRAAGLMTAEELKLAGIEEWSGVVYQWTFEVDCGIDDANFKGEAAPEVTVGENGLGVDSTTEVRLATRPDDPPETACGGS
jgi:hypothetical protein